MVRKYRKIARKRNYEEIVQKYFRKNKVCLKAKKEMVGRCWK
jgi:hypothetical protein